MKTRILIISISLLVVAVVIYFGRKYYFKMLLEKQEGLLSVRQKEGRSISFVR